MTRAELHGRLLQAELVIYRTVLVLCVLLLGIIVVTVSAAVFARFIVFTPLNFADPLSKYLMQWMAFLSVGLAMKRGEHVLVDAFASVLPKPVRRVLAVLIGAAVALLFATILKHGITNALSARTSSDPFVWGVSMIYPYLSVPVGAAYAMVQALLSVGLTLTAPADEAPLPHVVAGL